ncbi:MAG: XRE family transcriptional regulator [Zoogloeaceae bacterium]|jgi:predicted XRE-type DNA-binding protein|nr:XRE family transcriptional regulator [Zoogloeaceae bacterium]
MSNERFESVWDALADSSSEAANLSARAGLMREIIGIVRENGWKQAEAAQHLGVTQPRVNDLLHGRVSRFSLDALVIMAAHMGRKTHVELLAA